jgi:ABC-type phosphate transport system permease subunit
LLGFAGLLFTPVAMVIAQTLLATPIVTALVHPALTTLWSDYGDLLRMDGASKRRVILELFVIGRGALVTAFLAAFGRAIAEVGAIIIVGGKSAARNSSPWRRHGGDPILQVSSNRKTAGAAWLKVNFPKDYSCREFWNGVVRLVISN